MDICDQREVFYKIGYFLDGSEEVGTNTQICSFVGCS